MLNQTLTPNAEIRKNSIVTFSVDGTHTLIGEVIAEPRHRTALVKFFDSYGNLCVAPMGFSVLTVKSS